MDNLICCYRKDNDNFTYTHTVSQPPNAGNSHIHETYEVYFLISGDVTYFIEGQTYKLEKNDILIMNNRELHKPYFDSNNPYERIVIQFLPEYVSIFQDPGYDILNIFDKRKPGRYNRIIADEVSRYGIQRYLQQMGGYLMGDAPEKHVMAKTLFIQMIVELNKIFINSKTALDGFTFDPKLNSILEYINNNLNEKITLDMLQNEFYVNKHYLCHLFKKHTGFTVMEYITHKRIMKARELLALQSPVMDTCYKAGFNDYSNFYKAFKKYTGKSPSEFLR